MNELAPTPETGSASLAEPLWKIRWKLTRRSFAQNWEIFRESRIGMIGIILIIAFGIFGALWPIMINTVWDPLVYDPVVGFDPMTMHPSPPSASHLLGTDPIGRDILAQLMYSTGREFLLGVLSAVITVVIGTAVGTAAAMLWWIRRYFFHAHS